MSDWKIEAEVKEEPQDETSVVGEEDHLLTARHTLASESVTRIKEEEEEEEDVKQEPGEREESV